MQTCSQEKKLYITFTYVIDLLFLDYFLDFIFEFFNHTLTIDFFHSMNGSHQKHLRTKKNDASCEITFANSQLPSNQSFLQHFGSLIYL
jgi:hypothetical protein